MFSALAAAALASFATFACNQDPGDAGREQPRDAERGSLGKADLWGSCLGISHASGSPTRVEYCGDASDGTCWCDEACVRWGDCCDDYRQVCENEQQGGDDGSSCEPGQLECPGCCGNTYCSDADSCAIPICPAYCEPPSW
jgi:hypothetical protein